MLILICRRTRRLAPLIVAHWLMDIVAAFMNVRFCGASAERTASSRSSMINHPTDPSLGFDDAEVAAAVHQTHQIQHAVEVALLARGNG